MDETDAYTDKQHKKDVINILSTLHKCAVDLLYYDYKGIECDKHVSQYIIDIKLEIERVNSYFIDYLEAYIYNAYETENQNRLSCRYRDVLNKETTDNTIKHCLLLSTQFIECKISHICKKNDKTGIKYYIHYIDMPYNYLDVYRYSNKYLPDEVKNENHMQAIINVDALIEKILEQVSGIVEKVRCVPREITMMTSIVTLKILHALSQEIDEQLKELNLE